MKRFAAVLTLALASPLILAAQQERPASPEGTATAVVGGTWVRNAAGNQVYQGGKWIEVIYSRPMLRQRTNIFGTGAEYGVAVRGGTALWRAGANLTTVLKTEVPLVFGGKTVAAGEYGLLVDLKSPTEWTLVITSQKRGTPAPPGAAPTTDLLGAQNYDPKFDVVRVPMHVDSKAPSKLDQFTIYFSDVTRTGGRLAIAWEHTVATVEFTVG
jgi:hypothetical protein